MSIHFGILLVSVKTKVGSAMETARAIRSPETWNILESLGVRARRSPIDLAVKKKWLWHFCVGDFSVLRSLAFPWSIPENGESYQMGWNHHCCGLGVASGIIRRSNKKLTLLLERPAAGAARRKTASLKTRCSCGGHGASDRSTKMCMFSCFSILSPNGNHICQAHL